MVGPPYQFMWGGLHDVVAMSAEIGIVVISGTPNSCGVRGEFLCDGGEYLLLVPHQVHLVDGEGDVGDA